MMPQLHILESWVEFGRWLVILIMLLAPFLAAAMASSTATVTQEK